MSDVGSNSNLMDPSIPASQNHQNIEQPQQPPSPSVPEINHGEVLSPSNSIPILLMRPTTMEPVLGSLNPTQPDQTILVHDSRTKVQDLKSYVSQNWKGKPKLEGIRLIARGRILNDSESVGESLGKLPVDQTAHPIHVVIKPNAWTEKCTSAPTRSASAPPSALINHPAPTSNPPAIPSAPPGPFNLGPSSTTQSNLINPPNNENDPMSFLSGSTLPTSVHGTNNTNTTSPAQCFINHFSGLTSYGKLSFISNMLQAQFKIVERVDLLRRQIHNHHLQLVGINDLESKKPIPSQDQLTKDEQDWKLLEQKLTKLLSDLNFGSQPSEPPSGSLAETGDSLTTLGSSSFSDEKGSFKRVEIAGLPYLLYIPNGLNRLSGQHESTSGSHLKVYRSLQKDLDRALYLEAQAQLLILQIQKLHAGRHQVDEIIGAIDPTTSVGHVNYAQRIQNIVNGLVVAPFPPPAVAGLPGFAPAPAPANGVPGAGLGFGLGMGPEGLMPPNNILFPNGPMWQHPMARVRRYEFTINLDSIRRYLAPLLWLSLKLSVLLYIFGRHASYSKLVILTLIALGWVLWEAFSISQRHEAQVRRRDRLQRGQQAPGGGAGQVVDPIQAVLDRGRRRAERERIAREQREQLPRGDNPPGTDHNLDAPAAPNNPPPVTPAAAPAAVAQAPVVVAPARRNPAARGLRAAAADIRARGGAFPPGTEVRPFRTTSAFSPKYWFNSIAVVGLASEYRELGLHSIGERAMGASNLEYPRWYRYLRNFKTGVVLFFGTLLPEIEKKRRKALEKRARILNLVIADAARDANNQPNRNQNQDQRPAGQAVDDNPGDNNINLGANLETEQPDSTTTVPSLNERAQSPPLQQAEAPGQSTPRAIRATALEGTSLETANHASLLRRSNLSGVDSSEVDEMISRKGGTIHTGNSPDGNHLLTRTPLQERITRLNLGSHQPSQSSSSRDGGLLDVNHEALPTTTTNAGNTDHQASSSITNHPIAGSSSSSSSNIITNTDSTSQQQPQLDPALQSPLTPLDAHHQVVGGLDDTDDEEIIGGDNDEAGMLLF